MDSILGYEQFNTQPRPAKIAALCTIARNRGVRADVNFAKKTAEDQAAVGHDEDEAMDEDEDDR